MAFSVRRAHMTAVESLKAVSPYYSQQLQLIVYSAAADVDWDIGDFTGTFWTAALADGTYGAVAAKALAALKDFAVNAAYANNPAGNFDLYRTRVKTATDTADYEITSWTGKVPNITFAAASGAGNSDVRLSWGMLPGWQPVTGDLLP